MSKSRLVQVSGWSAILSGVLILVVVFLDLITIDFSDLGQDATTSAFRFYAVLSLIAALLLLLGLVGFYLRQSENVGTRGLVSFLVAFIGTALVAGQFWAQAFGATTLAEKAPQVLAEPSSSGWLGYGFTLSLYAFAIGWILFGVVTFLSGSKGDDDNFPRAAAVLLTIGAGLSLGPIPFTEAIFGSAIIWLGIDNLMRSQEKASQDAF